jgi:hypothetical protein
MKLSARRLRRLPAVVLPQVPQQAQLLDTVRRFDPDAALTDGGISFGAGIRLAGPQQITPDLGQKAEVPPGHAWVTSDSGPFQTWLVRGLAKRFGGYAHLPQPVIADDVSEVVIVHTPRQVSPGELAARLSGHVPGLAPAGGREEDGSFFLTSQASPIRIRCDSPDVPSLRWLLPLALGPLRQEPGLHGYRFGSDLADPRVVRPAVAAALELAQGVGGVATDRDRFRVDAIDEPALYR